MALPYQFYIIPIGSIFTFLSSIACIAFKTTASHSYNEATGHGSMRGFVSLILEFPEEWIRLGTYPHHLGLNGTTLVLVASSIALVISTGFAALSALVMLKHSPVKLLWYMKQALLFVLFANASLALVAFVTTFVLHGKSEHFSLYYRSPDGGFGSGNAYDAGVFDLETWTCEVKNLPSLRSEETLGQQCGAEVAGRFCTVIIFIFAFILFIAVWWDARKQCSLIVVRSEMCPMASDDEDDCELDEFAVITHLGPTSLRPNRK